jgi:hypothetical protein
LEEHNNWRVPERRVAKFVKRFRRAPGDGAADDDDMSTMSAISTASSVVSQRARSVVKGVGNILHLRRPKNKLDKESTRDHPAVVSLLGDISPHDDGVSEVHEDDPLDSLLFASPVPPNHPAGSPIFSPSPLLPPKKEKMKETQPDDSEAVTALESVVEEAEAEAELKGRALAFADDEDGLVYADENDGKKQGGLCEPCEGCIIL